MQAECALAPAIRQDLVLRPHLFSQDHGIVQVRAGQTLQAMLDEAAQGADIAATVRVQIGGIDVPREVWARVKPKAGTAIHVTVMPAGGSAKKILRSVLLIAVMVVAWYAAPFLTGAFGVFAGVSTAVVAAGLYMVGSLIVNALVPPPKPSMGGGGALGDVGRFNALTGSSNQAAPYGPIPLVVGEARVFPPHAAMPYSETIGQVSYQRLMFDLGYGDVEVSDLRIGDSPLSAFEDVEYEVTKTPTLYTDDISESSVSAQMNDSDTAVRTTAPNTDEISVDIVFGQGLFGIDKKGNLVTALATIKVEYRAVGSGTWLTVPSPGTVTGGKKARTVALKFLTASLNLQASTPDRKPFAASYSWGVALGQYEVRVTRTATNWGAAEANTRIGDASWTVLRSIRKTDPSRTGTTKLCMRIKASEQLNGTLQTLSCVVRQKIPVYNRATGTWSAPTFNLNPAWVIHWLLTTCPALTVRIPASRVDLTSLADFADFCTANDFEVRGCQDSRTTARQLLDDVLACSLGALTMRDGRYGVLFDSGTTVPTMVFTPLETKGFSVSRTFTRLPHALKVRFRNPNADWEMDEIIVLDDGYSYRGVDARGNASGAPAPTEFEAIELRMAADPHQAWRVGRHHFAQAKFRPNIYSWDTDVANLGCVRGDLVHVAHDVTEWGTGWGRVKSLVGNVLTLDESVELVGGVGYSARIRLQNGSSVVVGVTTAGGNPTREFSLASVPGGINVGDIVVIGETAKETKPLLITGVIPSADLGAKLTAVEYDSRVAPYWTNPPATIVSEVTGTAFLDPPPPPNIVVVLSNNLNDVPNDGGSTAPEVHVAVQPRSGYQAPPSRNSDHVRYQER
ncbi:host specificity factor TipJ family phage tail protein [Lysobacter soli]|uniref:host specificity factor TipJ family phage tail protein n=1 Tax=Lysobacter soli TaxID=453783 RepID=UPI0037C4F669